MKYEKKYVRYLNAPKKPSYPRVWERRSPTWGKTIPRRFLPLIFSRLTLALYFVAYNVQ